MDNWITPRNVSQASNMLKAVERIVGEESVKGVRAKDLLASESEGVPRYRHKDDDVPY